MREAPHTKSLGMWVAFASVLRPSQLPSTLLDSAPAPCITQAQGASFAWDILEVSSPQLGKFPGPLGGDFFQETHHR